MFRIWCLVEEAPDTGLIYTLGEVEERLSVNI